MITGIKDSKDVGLAICKALNLDAGLVQRIILDLPAEGVIKVYVQMMGDRQLLDIDWAAALGKSEVIKCADAKVAGADFGKRRRHAPRLPCVLR